MTDFLWKLRNNRSSRLGVIVTNGTVETYPTNVVSLLVLEKTAILFFDRSECLSSLCIRIHIFIIGMNGTAQDFQARIQ